MTERASLRTHRRNVSAIGLALAVLCAAHSARAQVPPLTREMLLNLSSIQEVHEGLALEDYDLVAAAARELAARAKQLQAADVASFKIDPALDPQFDAFLGAQRDAARVIEDAARAGDPRGVVLGAESMYRNACLGCHASFRERNAMLRPATLFMTGFLTAEREIQRGLSTADHALVARQARELSAVLRVLSWDQVIASTFALEVAEDRTEFRGFLNRMEVAASQLESAAIEEDVTRQLAAWRALWQEGCVSCHERFRSAGSQKR